MVSVIVKLCQCRSYSHMNLNILIIEDDPSFILNVEMMLEELGDFQFDSAKNLIEAKEKIKTKPDLIILDMRLKDNSLGIILLEQIQNLSIPFIVSTAFNDEDLYQKTKPFNPEAYLVKPFDKLTLFAIVERVFPVNKTETLKYSTNGIFLKTNKKFQKILFNDIKYIKAEGNYCSIYTSDGRVTIRNSIKKFIDKIDSASFVRVHRSYIANIKQISSVEFGKNLIQFEGGEIPIGRNYKASLKKAILLD